jgi:hypothetical protein
MHRIFSTVAERDGYSQWLARVVPVELPPAVEKSPVSEPLDWHPDHEDHNLMIASFTLDPRMPLPRTAFAQ